MDNNDLLRRAAKAAGPKTLHLALKGEYFDAIKAGTKTEEYRNRVQFWANRIEGRSFERIVLTRGYPRLDQSECRLVLPWRGYTIKTIKHPHFGDKPVQVYAIDVSAAALCGDVGGEDGKD